MSLIFVPVNLRDLEVVYLVQAKHSKWKISMGITSGMKAIPERQNCTIICTTFFGVYLENSTIISQRVEENTASE